MPLKVHSAGPPCRTNGVFARDDGLAAEFRVLCIAARRPVRPADTEALAAAAAAGVDWTAVLHGARRHRVSGLVLPALQACGGVPPAVTDALRDAATDNARRCLVQAAETAGLARRFAAAGVRVIVLKGVALSQQLYGDLSVRGAGDIDLLVDPADFWTADGILAAAGYRVDGGPISPARRTAGLRLIRDLTYRHESRGTLVELHQRLTANPHRMPCDFDMLWRDRTETTLAGAAIATLPTRVLPLYLCIHGAHHCWERLCWLADLAMLLKDGGTAATALADAEDAGLGAPMRLTMALCRDWLDVPTPSDVDARRFTMRFFGGARWLVEPPRGSLAWLRRELWRRRYLYSLKKGWSHRWNEVRADLANPVDWQVFPLPDRLLWLYPVLRPLGWMVRNLWRRR